MAQWFADLVNDPNGYTRDYTQKILHTNLGGISQNVAMKTYHLQTSEYWIRVNPQTATTFLELALSTLHAAWVISPLYSFLYKDVLYHHFEKTHNNARHSDDNSVAYPDSYMYLRRATLLWTWSIDTMKGRFTGYWYIHLTRIYKCLNQWRWLAWID